MLQVLANIETAQRNNRLFAALKEGNAAMAQLQKQVTLADVEQLNEESADAREYQERVQEMLSQSLTAQDDAAVIDELERIQVSSLVSSDPLPTRKTTPIQTVLLLSQPMSRALKLGSLGNGERSRYAKKDMASRLCKRSECQTWRCMVLARDRLLAIVQYMLRQRMSLSRFLSRRLLCIFSKHAVISH